MGQAAFNANSPTLHGGCPAAPVCAVDIYLGLAQPDWLVNGDTAAARSVTTLGMQNVHSAGLTI